MKINIPCHRVVLRIKRDNKCLVSNLVHGAWKWPTCLIIIIVVVTIITLCSLLLFLGQLSKESPLQKGNFGVHPEE